MIMHAQVYLPVISSSTLADKFCLAIFNMSRGGQVSYCPGMTVGGSLISSNPLVEASSVTIVTHSSSLRTKPISAVVRRQVRLP